MTDNPSPKGNDSVSCTDSVWTCIRSACRKLRSYWVRYVTVTRHHRFRRAGRTLLAAIGAITLITIAMSVAFSALSGAIWNWLTSAWSKWDDPVDTIASAIVTALVAVFAARISVKSSNKQLALAALDQNEKLYARNIRIEDALETALYGLEGGERAFPKIDGTPFNQQDLPTAALKNIRKGKCALDAIIADLLKYSKEREDLEIISNDLRSIISIVDGIKFDISEEIYKKDQETIEILIREIRLIIPEIKQKSAHARHNARIIGVKIDNTICNN